MDQENLKIIIGITENLLQKLGIVGKIEARVDEQNSICLKIETEESGLLIGYHGETLYSLQLIIGLITFRKLGTWIHLVLEVGDYRQRHEEKIIQMAKNIADRVKQTGQQASMPYLTGSERRIVHLTLQDDPDVISESEGEGIDRRLILKPRNPSPPPSPEPK
jgi:spoIIIJ-associated protein